MSKFLKSSFTAVLLLTGLVLFSQTKEPSPFDFGRMWTFENPPKEWFKEAYDFDPGDEWFDDVRKASLRFATWCSASFVSPDGLIMTNHHCSRDEGIKIQNDGENFDENGFYAETLSDERKVEGLFVEQLIKVANITDEVMEMSKDGDLEDKAKAIEKIQEKYASMADWADLRLQVVDYYSGAKYSLYGYKKYDDIRLVCMPENSIGFYGGDPDNFTYPRYNLDFTFWRAYDSNGNPVNSQANYLPFNPNGIEEGSTVFVVGNPGRTERYRTATQLAYDRDHRYKNVLKFLQNRIELYQGEYNEMVKNPEKEREAQDLLGTITNLANSGKAYGGIVKGLNDPELFGRKVAMENLIRDQSKGVSYWDDLSKEYERLTPHAWAINNLSPSPLRGKVLEYMHALNGYEQMLSADNAPDSTKMSTKQQLIDKAKELQTPKEKKMLGLLLEEIHSAREGKTVSKDITSKLVEGIYAGSTFLNGGDVEGLLKKDKKFMKSQDPLLKMSRDLIPAFNEAVGAYQEGSDYRQDLEAKIANQVFNVYGETLPPDATFTLRISDGVIKGYDYNGTTAPYQTTFFGMYDRHFSNGQEYPWNLPERWQNPSMELLKSPVNVVSTNDIIGGNSGSPLINENKEAVGLIFDGNIESLPGNFIFDEVGNRTVSVHAGGIYAALKYVYKATRLANELVSSQK